MNNNKICSQCLIKPCCQDICNELKHILKKRITNKIKPMSNKNIDIELDKNNKCVVCGNDKCVTLGACIICIRCGTDYRYELAYDGDTQIIILDKVTFSNEIPEMNNLKNSLFNFNIVKENRFIMFQKYFNLP